MPSQYGGGSNPKMMMKSMKLTKTQMKKLENKDYRAGGMVISTVDNRKTK